jgi:ribosomal protein L37AE/L43A
MTDCPCCSNRMLRHLRGHQLYWFCRHCYQEMPSLDSTLDRGDRYNLSDVLRHVATV